MKQGKEQSLRQREALFTLEGRPGLGLVLPFAMQQILAMFVTNMVPIGIIAAAASPALTEAEIYSLMQSAMIAAGIATFIQVTPIGRLGSGLPVFMGVSFTFVVPLSAIAAKYGYGAVTGTVLIGGILEGLLGLTVRYWRNIMAPVVSAVVVTGIGLSLLGTAARSPKGKKTALPGRRSEAHGDHLFSAGIVLIQGDEKRKLPGGCPGSFSMSIEERDCYSARSNEN